MSIEKNKTRKEKITWKVLLPNEETELIKLSNTATVRGLIQSIPFKPDELTMDKCTIEMKKDNITKTLKLDSLIITETTNEV